MRPLPFISSFFSFISQTNYNLSLKLQLIHQSINSWDIYVIEGKVLKVSGMLFEIIGQILWVQGRIIKKCSPMELHLFQYEDYIESIT